jgi:hypothetical protein
VSPELRQVEPTHGKGFNARLRGSDLRAQTSTVSPEFFAPGCNSGRVKARVREIAYPHLKSLPNERPATLPAARLATLFPALPFLTALASPMSRATLYRAFRNPIDPTPLAFPVIRLLFY